MRTNELQHLQPTLIVRCTTGCATDVHVRHAPTALLCALRKRLDHRRVRDVFGGAARDIRQRIELLAPRLSDRRRVG